MKKALFFATAWFWLVGAHPVVAQPALEQLEQRVRKEAAPAGDNVAKADAQGDAAELRPPVNPSPRTITQPADSTANPPAQERGYLGIVADDRLDRGRGVRIQEVRPGGPGEKAGLRPKDLITGLQGIRVRQMSDLAGILQQLVPGVSLKFDIVRGEQPLQVDVTSGRVPVAVPGVVPPAAKPAATKPAELNLTAPGLPNQSTSPAGAASGSPMRPLPVPITPPVPDNVQSDRARIEVLERLVKRLEERIEQLERERSPKK